MFPESNIIGVNHFNTINSNNDDNDEANISDKHDVVRLDVEVDNVHLMQEDQALGGRQH